MCYSNTGYFLNPSPSIYHNPYPSYNCYYTPHCCGGYHNGGFYNGGLGLDCASSSLSLIALFALLCR